MAQITVEEFKNFFKYYNGEEHQQRAIELLYKEMDCDYADHLDEGTAWIKRYRTPVKSHGQKPTNKQLLSKAQLAAIWECSESLIQDYEVDELNKCLNNYEINTTQRMRHFLSQTAHESGGGKWKKELSDGWYLEGRTDIGNTQAGDGPKYKGAGYIQLTGRANYQDFSNYIKDDPQIMSVGCDRVAEEYPFRSAGFWWTNNRMNDLCDSGADVYAVTRRVNGGTNGLADREHYYAICEREIR